MLIFSVVLYLKIIIIIIIIIIMITYSFFKNIIIIIIIIIIIVIIIIIIIIIDSMNATGTWLHYGKSVIVVITVFVPWGLYPGGGDFNPITLFFGLLFTGKRACKGTW